MDINLSISQAPAIISNYLVVAVYNSTAPAAVASYQSFPAPHASPKNITFTNLSLNVYIVKIFESLDGSPTGVIRHQFVYDPTFGITQIRIDEVLIAGVTPNFNVGANSYDNPTWASWEVSIERKGAGTLVDGTLSSVSADYLPKPSGGFTLTNEGDVFGNGEIFIVSFLPQINSSAPQTSQTAGVLWGDSKDILADTVLTTNDMGKYCLIAGAGAVVNITLPSGDTAVDGTMIAFLSEGGIHLAANLIPAGSDTIKWLGDTWTNADPFTLCQGEEVWLLYHGNSWRVAMADGAWKNVGELVYDYNLTPFNMLQADGNVNAGALYNRSYYPRLWRWVNKFLDVSMLVTDSNWNFRTTQGATYHFYPNVGKFSSGDGISTFRVPLLMKTKDTDGNLKAGGFLRAVNGSSDKAGAQYADCVGNFAADITGRIIQLANSTNHTDGVLVLGDGGYSHGNGDQGAGTQNNVAFNGKDLITLALNGETRPFSTNIYCFIRY